MEACDEHYGDLGMSYSEAKHRPHKPFLSIPRQAAISWVAQHMSVPFTDDVSLLCDTAVPTHREFLFVNWRFILCLTELKFRSLCLMSETKGKHTPMQKLVKSYRACWVFLTVSLGRALLNVLSSWEILRSLRMLFISRWHPQRYLKNTWNLGALFCFVLFRLH